MNRTTLAALVLTLLLPLGTDELPQRGDAPGFFGLSSDCSLAYDATGDALWVAHSVRAADEHVVVRWYEIDLRGWPGGPRPELV